MKIILFRHGKKQEYQLNGDRNNVISLTVEGIDQIIKLANILKVRFSKLIDSRYLFSSPFPRTIQSAEIVRSILNIKEILVYEEFKKFHPKLNYKGDNKEERKLFVKAMQDHDWIPPETKISFKESILNFQKRLKIIYEENLNETVLVSTHGGIVRNMIYDLEPNLRPNNEKIDTAFIHEGGYTILNFGGKNFEVEEFDVHDFLD